MAKSRRHRGVGWGAAPRAGEGGSSGGWGEARAPVRDLNVAETVSLVSPFEVREDIPLTPAGHRTVVESREIVKRILNGSDKRLLVIAGPCSIHDDQAALEYAQRLVDLTREVVDRLYVVMRVYFEKPRTTVGWKGLINDPHLDGTFDMETGIRKARRILLAVTDMGLPTATEFLDPITPQYIADLITWAAIGARTTESQTHRQMASGLSMPVGYKNATDGNLEIAINALQSAQYAHSFLGIDENGRTAVIKTRGNRWGHVILRGGRDGPNYDPQSVAHAIEALREAKLPTRLMIDCSHANCGKKHQNQELVWNSVIQQRLEGNTSLVGIMLESNLCEGNQLLPADLSTLRYGVSVTDECMGWAKTEELLRAGHRALGGEPSI
ncbi:MAG: 3-deoxy-7-phosphoheptulonate synthase [Phycisphaerales bacterium]|nr:MAG: 3-deoxy-7-phosphoheptulonate synthase [Phycisphaerales bacterium]